MELLVPISHLRLLVPGLDLQACDEAKIEQIRQHFAFLGPIQVTLTSDSVVLTLADHSPGKNSEADRLADRAVKRAREGDFSRAAELYQRALSFAPTQANTHRELAMCLMELGRLEEAKDVLIDALKLSPADAWSFVILANVYSKLSKPELARPLYLRAIELKPSDPWALNGLATAEMALGNAAAGLARFTEATLAHPAFPNAWHGKALAEFRDNRPADAELSLRQLFSHARAEDARARHVFAEARRLFLDVQKTLAERAESDAFKSVQALRAEVEQLSGFPVEFSFEKQLPGGVAALARIAWKHRTDRHLILMRADSPSATSAHLQSHELTHIQLESYARAAGRNRFFSTNPATQDAALAALAPELRRVSRHLARPENAPAFASQLIAGVCGLVFNTPLDLLIERRLHRDRQALRPAQILSLHALAKEGIAGTFKPEIRQITPPTILRAAEAMNGLAALS